MKRTWTIIAVGDVPGSLKWYQALFGQTPTREAAHLSEGSRESSKSAHGSLRLTMSTGNLLFAPQKLRRFKLRGRR
jgi:hypothetical protein